MVQGNPDATPAQERVFFLDREIGQGLVAADVQGTHGHRVGREGFQLLPIVFPLLLLRWEAILDHERHFSAVQAYPFGAALLGTGIFALLAFQVYRRRENDPARMAPEKRLFKYSILYLFLLFGAVVVDRWLLA